MDLAHQLLDAVRQITPEQRSSARAFHNAMENGLVKKGWKVVREFCVKDRGDGVRGRIDLVVLSPCRIGIELDNVIVRKKSRFKLSQFDGSGFVVLRQSGRIVECKKAPNPNPGS